MERMSCKHVNSCELTACESMIADKIKSALLDMTTVDVYHNHICKLIVSTSSCLDVYSVFHSPLP